MKQKNLRNIIFGALVLGVVLILGVVSGVFTDENGIGEDNGNVTEGGYGLGELGPSYPENEVGSSEPEIILPNGDNILDVHQLEFTFVNVGSHRVSYDVSFDYDYPNDAGFTIGTDGQVINNYEFSISKKVRTITIKGTTQLPEYVEGGAIPMYVPAVFEIDLNVEDLEEYGYKGVILFEDEGISFHAVVLDSLMILERAPPIISYVSERLE
ncbi:hypothetical protein HOC01_04970 [archaeon]|jgi:hypothetical protein|nr:hypothetical protein [archaeon]MBT6698320.1 hypothetical protein [archaeon]